jgi:hypothetical protein
MKKHTLLATNQELSIELKEEDECSTNITEEDDSEEVNPEITNNNLLQSMGTIFNKKTINILKTIRFLRKYKPREKRRVGYSKPTLESRVQKRRKKHKKR